MSGSTGITLGDGCYVIDLGAGERARVEGGNQAEDLAFARRLFACWNACNGISTEALEAGALEEARGSLKSLVDWFLVHVHGGGETTKARKDYQRDVQTARAALAKLEGKP